MEYKYDVCLSFAGQDRDYVEKVAAILKENDIKVFYDKFEQVGLWGKDLGVHFDYIYGRAAKYFIPFISVHYKERAWTEYEVKTAISRAIENREDYILPARFDDTKIDGIRSSVGMMDLRKYSTEEFAEIILQKIRGDNEEIVNKTETKSNNVYLTSRLILSEMRGLVGMDITVVVTNIEREHRYFQPPYFRINDPVKGEAYAFQMLEQTVPITFPKRMELGEQYKVSYSIKHGFIDKLKDFSGQEAELIAIVSTTLGEKYYSNPVKIDEVINTWNNDKI